MKHSDPRGRSCSSRIVFFCRAGYINTGYRTFYLLTLPPAPTHPPTLVGMYRTRHPPTPRLQDIGTEGVATVDVYWRSGSWLAARCGLAASSSGYRLRSRVSPPLSQLTSSPSSRLSLRSTPSPRRPRRQRARSDVVVLLVAAPAVGPAKNASSSFAPQAELFFL